MKERKRILKKGRFLAVLAAVCCMVMPMTVMAADDTASQQEISVTLTAEPEYIVTIPSSVTMGNDGTTVNVTAENVKNLPEGKRISVSIVGTSGYRNQMVLEAQTSPRTSIRYQIISETGELIETNASTGAVGVGKEVVSFSEAGTKQYEIRPVIAGRYEYNVPYTGSITFGIQII